MVPLGFRIACLRATCPTSRSPVSVNATTDGVVRDPSAFGMTVGCPPSTAAMTEFVVPRSIPTALAMVASQVVSGSVTSELIHERLECLVLFAQQAAEGANEGLGRG